MGTPTEEYAQARQSGANRPKGTSLITRYWKEILLVLALIVVLPLTYRYATSSNPNKVVENDINNAGEIISKELLGLKSSIDQLVAEIRQDRAINPDLPRHVEPEIRYVTKWRTRIEYKTRWKTKYKDRIVYRYRDNAELRAELARLRDCYTYQKTLIRTFTAAPRRAGWRQRLVLANNCGTIDNRTNDTTVKEYMN
jgi:hypothetical protein